MVNRVSIEANVLKAARDGDLRAFEHIVSEYERPIYSFIYRMVSNRSDAEDLTQETFVKLYIHIRKYDSEKNFSAWIFTIARRTVYDWLRKKMRSKESFSLDNPDTLFEPADKSTETILPYDKIGDEIDIEEALMRLRPHYKEVLLLYYWQRYNYAEISDILDMPLNTIKTLIRRAKQALYNELHQSQ